MHASSLENMHKCVARYATDRCFKPSSVLRVLDIGAADVNGTYRSLFPPGRANFTGVDLTDGPGVDVVLSDPNVLPFPAESFDLVLSGQMLEHSPLFWKAFEEMARVVTSDGFIFLIAPSAGPIHRYPVDCYRFYPDAYVALAQCSGLKLVEHWLDERGPWRDLVGVFTKNRETEVVRSPCGALDQPSVRTDPHPEPTVEAVSGSSPRDELLARIHEALGPRLYLEIGVRRGASLALARGRALAVDPLPELAEVPDHVRLFRRTSDDFFELDAAEAIKESLDFVLIDGMHRFEYALRDFMNVERRSSPTTLVVIDDTHPNHPIQARRERDSRVWTGDVWKLVDVLAQRRPDLTLIELDVAPTGMTLVCGLDSGNRALWDHYNPIVRANTEHRDPPEDVISRARAWAPDDPRLDTVCSVLCSARAVGNVREVRARLRQAAGVVASDPARTRGRSFGVGVPGPVLSLIQKGVLATRYRDRAFLKSPFDIGIYMQALERVRPRTIIEIGYKEGGSALWFADQLTARGVQGRVVSVDIEVKRPSDDPRITVFECDARQLATVLTREVLVALERPWIVVEDSAHTFEVVDAVLQFFHRYLRPGDLMVVEDGVVAALPERLYERYQDGPNRAVRQFLAQYPNQYEIDRALCDLYGPNVTFNPNGWLRRI